MGSTPNVVSSPEAHAHPSDDRDALHEALTNFVTDSMYDRPQDILEYMVTWARKQLLQKQGRGEAVTAQDTQVPRLSITPTAITSVIQAAVFSETAEEADPAAGAEAANRLRHLAENRQKRYRDIAQGCLDNYLISLEDSDGDLFHIDALRRKMEGTRQQAMNARGDTAAIAAQLKAVEESEGTATQRAREQAALLHEYEQRWAHEALDKFRT